MSGHKDTSTGGSISTRLDEAIAQIARTRTLLVALDFDGTLSETVDNPEDARALPGSRAAVIDLLELNDTRVAVISGRALASLERVSGLPSSVALVGSHGSEFRVDGEESAPVVDTETGQLLSALYTALTAVAAHIDGVRIEKKPSGCGLHTRLCTPDDAERARDDALAAVAALEDEPTISSRYGKDILEFTVHAADKGTALTTLRERLAASAVVFIGDDVTDEDGFRALTPGDVGIKVGDGDTAAQYRVASPQALVVVLESLVAVRSDTLANRTR